MPLRLLLVLLLLTPTGATFAQEVETDDEIVAAEAEAGHGATAGHGADGGHGGGGTPDPLATDPDLAIWTLIVFLVMLALLSQTAWKPIMEALKAREDNITGAIAAAQRTHDEAKALLADHQAKIAGAADQVREMLAEAHRDAETTIAKAKADAKAEFDEERQRATRDIEQATDAAVRALAERTAGLAIDLAGRVVKQEITPARQSEIVREALGRFSSNGPSAN